MQPSVLIAEDDPSYREVIALGLAEEGFRTLVAADGASALEVFRAGQPDLVLLDVMLPKLDGFEVCRRIRAWSLTPIIMLTARTSTVDVVVGLESGADDYVTKPFRFPELVARIRAALRRSAGGSQPTGIPAGTLLQIGSLTIDDQGHTVTRGEVPIALTATEFRLLLELALHAGKVLSRGQLLQRVWGYPFLGDGRLVDVHIRRLRAKIEPDPGHPALIVTVRGVGYKAEG